MAVLGTKRFPMRDNTVNSVAASAMPVIRLCPLMQYHAIKNSEAIKMIPIANSILLPASFHLL